jgi:hypothetical protein
MVAYYPKLYPALIPDFLRKSLWDQIQQGLTRDAAIQTALGQVGQQTTDMLQITREIDALYDEYDKLCQTEYSPGITSSSVRSELVDEARNAGLLPWQYYKRVRPLYYGMGYLEPTNELNKITSYSFLGIPITGGVHSDFQNRLRIAEQQLDTLSAALKRDVKREIRDDIREKPIGGFVPRVIGGSEKTSYHALGRAIDIDPHTDPQIAGKDAAEIDQVLGWLLKKRDAGVSWLEQATFDGPYPMAQSFITFRSTPEDEARGAYQKMKADSDWIRYFLQHWLPRREVLKANLKKNKEFINNPRASPDERNQARDEIDIYENLEKLIRALSKAKPAISAKTAMESGIMTSPARLYEVMAAAGIRSGVTWIGQKDPKKPKKKDPMHFEFPPPKRGT